MNQNAEYTQPCEQCGVHFVASNVGRPQKFCCSACRVKHHRETSVTKPVTKASPNPERAHRMALVESVLNAYGRLDGVGRYVVRCQLKQELEMMERQTPDYTLDGIKGAIIKLSDSDFKELKKWINLGQ